jgi:cation transport ATPase
MNEDLTKISKLIDLAKKTMRAIRQNVLWAMSCSAAGVALAVSGLVHPAAAALLALASGFCVIANSMRFEAALQAELRREW